MSTAQEATVNPDGSTTFDDASGGAGSADDAGAGSNGGGYPGDDAPPPSDGDAIVPPRGGVDPALYLALAVVAFAVLFAYLQLRKRRKNAEVDDFFSNLDGDKFNLKLPPAVDDYYEVKGRCEGEGWEPGQVPENPGQPSAHHRMLAQALMKRCIADIPIVSHIQRESAGMNKLYSQSMCSVKQWKSYQAAEAMVSAEVEEVRAEADEIEPGWSNVSFVFSRMSFWFFRLSLVPRDRRSKMIDSAYQWGAPCWGLDHRPLNLTGRRRRGGGASSPLLFVRTTPTWSHRAQRSRRALSHTHTLTPPPFLFPPPSFSSLFQGGMEAGHAISQHAQAEGGAGQGAADGAG